MKQAIDARAIRAVRQRLGESQAQFSARMGINQGTISRWENHGLSKKIMTTYRAIERLQVELEKNDGK